ncbi:hypothetical protein [Longivirga aurantiaca]|uniref:Uncharacterized protein n=1 Tax=Longivirga aurantiaca TaxID=1837743 RepID=A0ABW1SZQ8_9ACTN
MDWTAFRSTPAFGYLIVGLVILYAGAREVAPGDLPSIALALELATTVCTRGVDLVIGPVLPSALTAAGLTLPSGVEHRDGDDDLETWTGAAISPGDFLVVPFDGTSIGAAADRVDRSLRSLLAVNHNPETAAALALSPMNLPVGRSLGA